MIELVVFVVKRDFAPKTIRSPLWSYYPEKKKKRKRKNECVKLTKISNFIIFKVNVFF